MSLRKSEKLYETETHIVVEKTTYTETGEEDDVSLKLFPKTDDGIDEAWKEIGRLFSGRG